MVKILRILYDINTLEIITCVIATEGYTMVPDATIGCIQCDVDVANDDATIRELLKAKTGLALDNFNFSVW